MISVLPPMISRTDLYSTVWSTALESISSMENLGILGRQNDKVDGKIKAVKLRSRHMYLGISLCTDYAATESING